MILGVISAFWKLRKLVDQRRTLHSFTKARFRTPYHPPVALRT
jgi:hypothetical protein